MVVRRAGWLLVVALTFAAFMGSAGAQSAGVETPGYWMLERDGTVYPFGGARHFGDRAGSGVDAVRIVSTPTGRGYLILDVGGDVHAFGDAPDLGGVSPFQLEAGERVTSISLHPTNRGYWVFTSRGQVFDFGEAEDFGDLTSFTLNGPVVGSVATPSGLGYWMVGSDGGVFSFGDAAFAGSMGGTPLNQPVNGLVPDPDGTGYWLVASDGGVFAFDAGFRGSMGSTPLNAPVVGMVAAGDGYIMVGSDGGAFVFSNGGFHGSLGSDPPDTPIVDITALDPLVAPGAITLSGSANSFAEACFTAEGGLTTVSGTHDGSSNFIVWLLDDANERDDLLLNEIGAFDGLGDALRIEAGEHCLDVTADGDWTVTIDQPRNEALGSPTSNSGSGNELLGPFQLDGTYRVTASHDGSSNFVVWVLEWDGRTEDLVINEIGAPSGTYGTEALDPGTYYVRVTADGDWTLGLTPLAG